MRRTQLYLEDETWKMLQVLARQAGCSVSALVRQAIRARYLQGAAHRKAAMQAVVGLWSGRADLPATQAYVRRLRKDTRLARLTR
ncbi:MAG: ribbon-helix-helix protein, CopG family [Acidobacteria bacterium]|nr:ribbon-helix-helix protein, CopG family [Acidobacteriota bacterium]